MKYHKWVRHNLTQATIRVRGGDVMVWSARQQPGRQTILLVHGITGDHFGLVPLIEVLSRTYNCLVVELPGHGGSQRMPLRDARDLQRWFQAAYTVIEHDLSPIDAVVAHSFGCTAVAGSSTRRSKTILINPVPQPSEMYTQYARLIMRFAGFWAIFYNVRLFIWLRSMTLAKIPSREARRRIGYVSRYSRPRYHQVIYQAGLVDIILDPAAYSHVKDVVDLVICGLEDTTAMQRDSLEMRRVFGTSPVEFLRGGHLSPIETPDRVAAMIDHVI